MKFIQKHIEWVVFTTGLILLGFMNPENSGTTFCLFDMAGIGFCPGEGLGHSIAYAFRGELSSALDAHFAGPMAIIVLSGRVFYLWSKIYKQSNLTIGNNHGSSN